MSSLGNDLATIRKRQHLTIEDIRDKTKIPIHILESIEDNSIFTDVEENITYIRSYVRGYGKALKLNDDLVVDALDQMEIGTYDGLLLKSVTGKGREEKPAEPTGQPGVDQEETVEKEKDIPTARGPGVEESAPDQETEKMPEPPSVSSVDWADMGKRFAPLQSKSRIWIGIVFVLAIIAVVLFFFVYQNSPTTINNESGESPVNLTQPEVAPDSLQVDLSQAESEQQNGQTELTRTETRTTLADTLTMLVYAAYGKLEPVRVYSDLMGNINPYWIEQGEAIQFEFVNEIRIRGQYSRMALLFNGHLVENFRNRFYSNETRMLEINRSFFENDDRWLQAAPDSIPGLSSPTTIIERPTFN